MVRKNAGRLVILWLTSCAPLAVHAQSATPPATNGGATGQTDDDASTGGAVDGNEIVVTGTRVRGQAIGDIPPEQTLSAGDIRSFGVSSISDLLDEISPETSSGRGRGGGRPVLLLNGQRISSFSELRDIPTEAIERVEILPEEVALKYGYRADQRVVNIVLREHFRAWTAQVKDKVPTEGGSNDVEGDGSYLRIRDGGRLNVKIEAENNSRLLESERGIIPAPPRIPYSLVGNVTAPPGAVSDEIDPGLSALAGYPVTVARAPVTAGAPDIADFAPGTAITDTTPYRSLRPATQRYSLNAVYGKRFGEVSATANVRLEKTDNQSLQGLAQAQLLLPAANPYSPFARDVALDRYAGTDPLHQKSREFTGHGGITLNGALSSWQWSVTGNFDRDETETDTQTGVDLGAIQSALTAGDPAVDPFAPGFLGGELMRTTDTAKSVSTVEQVDALLTGTVLSLPAGRISTSLKAGFQNSDYDSRSLRSGILQTGDVGRTQGNGQVNIDVPVADRDKDVLPFLGHLSLNANAEVEQLSDFGTLTSVGYGFNWQPVKPVEMIVSFTQEDGAPSPQQLGDPTIVTPNSRIFDYVTGQTVDVARISGGNPNLDSDDRKVLKIGLNVKPLDNPDLRLSGEYIHERIDDPIASFPVATAAIEAAFPDRFLRDGSGQLVRIDARPINFERSQRQQLRIGIDFTKRFRSEEDGRGEGHGYHRGGRYGGRHGDDAQTSDRDDDTDRQDANHGGPAGDIANDQGRHGRDQSANGGGPDHGSASDQGSHDQSGSGQNGSDRNGGSGEGDGGSDHRGHRGGGRFGHRGGGIRFSLYDTIHLQDRITIRQGVPVLDLLNGSATGNSGGQPRHEVELRAGYFKNGYGARLSGNFQSATRVDSGAVGDQSLRFSSLTTFDLRLFADLSQQASLVRRHPWLRGTRVSLSLGNIFDARQQVTGPDGVVPLSYQSAYLDPLGRTVRISIRKIFF